MGSYLPSTAQERREMLGELRLSSFDELYKHVPEQVRLKHGLDIPEGVSEMEAAAKLSALADKNRRYRAIFRGAGAYDHYIPAIVKSVTAKEEFLTAYTPYQAEISQGVLQSIFEYQTQICELTGMDVSNASVYDGAVAAAEAVFMCQERKRTGVIVPDTADAQVIRVIQTYCGSRNVPVTVLRTKGHALDADTLKEALKQDTACVYVQSPNFYGVIEDTTALARAAHEAGAKFIMGAYPISLGLLKSPGECGADIAVGEGQSLGLPLSFGGPYLGYMACRKELMRRLPGRIVGQTNDSEGRRCFVLTLQAREQHIRREKATSNICSNEALCAMTASVYLAAMGPEGLKRAAVNSAAHAHYLAQRLSEIKGFEPVTDKPFFNEFVARCPVPPAELQARLDKEGILGGLPVEGGVLWCCTEKNTREQIDRLAEILGEVSAE
ncbi:MAG: aminomethyl-transferring glycine dehydrogenase subunit GcvPA [Clostridiales bacterium]|nr:aminomethyl-transferring glycine dehydrogenase subunit GcvPA [Clostridiales bacterium]